jgi:hypothetical protein
MAHQEPSYSITDAALSRTILQTSPKVLQGRQPYAEIIASEIN